MKKKKLNFIGGNFVGRLTDTEAEILLILKITNLNQFSLKKILSFPNYL